MKYSSSRRFAVPTVYEGRIKNKNINFQSEILVVLAKVENHITVYYYYYYKHTVLTHCFLMARYYRAEDGNVGTRFVFNKMLLDTFQETMVKQKSRRKPLEMHPKKDILYGIGYEVKNDVVG